MRKLFAFAFIAFIIIALQGIGASDAEQGAGETGTAPAQDRVPPAIVTFSADLESVTYEAAEAGTETTTLSWRTVNMTDDYIIALHDFQANQWVSLMPEDTETLEPVGSLEVAVRHPLDFGQPRYRLVIVQDEGPIVSERTVEIAYEEPAEEAEPQINRFFAQQSSIQANALFYEGEQIVVEWDVSDRTPTTNLVFEQLLEDGTAAVVELPRFNTWVPSSGEGPVAPVLPQDSRSFVLQMRMVDFASSQTLDQAQVTIAIAGTLATPTPRPTDPPAAPVTNNNPPDNGNPDPNPNSNPNPNPNPVVNPGAGSGFELGGHVLGYGGADVMRSAGMSWAKVQIRWSPGEGTGAAAGAINAAHANGFKILLGIVGRTGDMGDFNSYVQAYANYVGQVAALGPDAIEVWNEPNLPREWPSGSIGGNSYTQLLAASYNAIKSANPNVMVISAALAPTGFYGGCTGSGCDDDPFLRQMVAAGAANYFDCLGAHYNEGIISPDQQSGDPRGGHYTRYFWGMLNRYASIFGGKKICWTELGYLSGEGWGALPPEFAWAGSTTLTQHAEWLGRAAALSRNSGKVRLMIVWNVDFTNVGQGGSDPQGGYAIIRPDGTCPACGPLRAAVQ